MTTATLTFLWCFVLVIVAVCTTAIDLLIALCCFVISLPSSFHFSSNYKKEKTPHTHTRTLSLSLFVSKSPNFNSPKTHCYPSNSPKIKLNGDPNHLKPPPISSKHLSFYLAIFLKWVCLKFQKIMFRSCGFVYVFFFPKNWLWVLIWFLKARVDGLCVASRVNVKITKYPRAETPERDRLRVTFGWRSWEKEKEEAIKPEPLSPIAALTTTTIFFAATSLPLVWVGFFLLFFFLPFKSSMCKSLLEFHSLV